MFFKQFGGKVTPQHRKQYQQSQNWNNGSFQNLEATNLNTSLMKMPGMLYKTFVNNKGRTPNQPIPVMPFDLSRFLAPAGSPQFIWYGHSAILMRMQHKNILIDPMLGPDTTPIAPFATKRFSENTLSLIDDFPEIDLLLMTHDHYDHLDFASIQKLKPKTKKYLVAIGVKRHLVKWGVPGEAITEVDWWDQYQFENINITFTPTRHFSGRGLTDRQRTLWGGWAFKTEQENIWFSGDGGYGQHFKEIGERLGPFDFAFMECGQYNDDWRPIHLFPDESVQAAIDAKAKKAMPVHWAGFSLSYQHTWTEPAEDFLKTAHNLQMDYLLPKIGQQFDLHSQDKDKWWLQF